MLHTQDLELAQRVAAKQRAAFDEFFNMYVGRLYRFCASRLQDESAVEDVVQITMHKALQHLASYRGEASLFTWLCQIGRNEMANWRARHAQQGGHEVPLDDRPEVRAALESLYAGDAVQRIELQQVVQLTLDHLPDQYGKALEWKYLEGLSVEEIGARLQINLVSAQSLLARARSAFRRSFIDLHHAVESSQ